MQAAVNRQEAVEMSPDCDRQMSSAHPFFKKAAWTFRFTNSFAMPPEPELLW